MKNKGASQSKNETKDSGIVLFLEFCSTIRHHYIICDKPAEKHFLFALLKDLIQKHRPEPSLFTTVIDNLIVLVIPAIQPPGGWKRPSLASMGTSYGAITVY